MSRPLGRLLLCKVLETTDLRTCVELRFDPVHHLTDLEDQEIYDFIWKHYNDTATYHQVPSVDLVKEVFPSYYHEPPDDTVASLCVQLFRDYVQRALDVMTLDVGDLLETDPYAALDLAREQISYIQAQSTPGAEDVDISANADSYIETLDNRQELDVGAVPWPWPTLNEELGGIHRGDYISIYGRPGSMKTWLATVIAEFAYMNANATVLFYSREMAPEVLVDRAVCRMLRMDYRKFRMRQLDPIQKSQAMEFVRTMHGDEVAIARYTGGRRKRFLVTSDYKGEGGGGTVDSLQLKIEEYEPDLVIVDGVYLMRGPLNRKDRLDWKNVYAVSQGLRATVNKFRVPILVTNQAKQSAAKTGGSTEEQAFADAFNQDVDLLIRIIKAKEMVNGKAERRLKLMFPKMRESGLLKGLVIGAQPALDFEEKSAIMDGADEELGNVVEEDTGGAYEKTRGRARVGKGTFRK